MLVSTTGKTKVENNKITFCPDLPSTNIASLSNLNHPMELYSKQNYSTGESDRLYCTTKGTNSVQLYKYEPELFSKKNNNLETKRANQA